MFTAITIDNLWRLLISGIRYAWLDFVDGTLSIWKLETWKSHDISPKNGNNDIIFAHLTKGPISKEWLKGLEFWYTENDLISMCFHKNYYSLPYLSSRPLEVSFSFTVFINIFSE